MKDVLLKVFGATTMSEMQHVAKRDEATKVREIKARLISSSMVDLEQQRQRLHHI